jgi:hypothetical protein
MGIRSSGPNKKAAENRVVRDHNTESYSAELSESMEMQAIVLETPNRPRGLRKKMFID